MPAMVAQLLSVHSRLAEEALEFLERLADAVDRTPWEFCGKKLKASSAFIEPIVFTQREIREEDDTPGRKAQRQSFGGSKVSLTDEVLMKQYERTRLSGKNEEKRWSQVLRAAGGLRLVVTGEPGSGKTCATRCTAAEVARVSAARLRGHESDVSEVTFPLWIMATDVAKLPDSIDLPDALLSASLAQPALADTLSSYLRSWLRKRVCGANSFIVIDALDEVPTLERNEVFLRRLGELRRTAASVVITCRTLPWERLKVCVPWQEARLTVELKPLDPRHQREHAKAFFLFLDRPDLAEEMDRRFTRDLPLREHARTPLILTFACGLLAEGELPAEASLAKLYRLVIDALLEGRWRQAVARPSWAEKSMQRDRVRLFLGPLGWKLFRASPEGNRYSLPQWDEAWTAAAALARAPANDSDALLDDLLTLGLLIDGGKDESGNACVSFAHRTVLEFLAAEGLSEDREQLHWLLQVQKPIEENPFWFKPAWLPNLTFLAAIMGDATPLINAVEIPPLIDGKSAPGDDFFRRMFGLKCRFAGVAPLTPDRIACELADEWLSQFDRILKASYTIDTSQQLYQLWPEYGRGLCAHLAAAARVFTNLRAWRELLGEESEEAGEIAIVLMKLGDRNSVPTFIRELEHCSYPFAYLVPALGTSGDARALICIKRLFYSPDSPHSSLRHAQGDEEILLDALINLGGIGGSEDITLLLSMAHGSEKEFAVRRLGQLQNEAAVEALEQLLKSESMSHVRSQIVEALASLSNPMIAASLIPLLRTENDAAVRVAQIFAIAALGKQFSDASFTRELIRWYEVETDLWPRRSIATALGIIGDTQAVKWLIDHLWTEPSEVQIRIIRGLGLSRDKNAVEPLLGALTSRSEEVFVALGLLGDRRATRALLNIISAVENGEDSVLFHLVEALGRIGDPEAIPPLLRLGNSWQWHDEQIEVFAEAFGLIQDCRAIPQLLQWGESHPFRMRAIARTIFEIVQKNGVYLPALT